MMKRNWMIGLLALTLATPLHAQDDPEKDLLRKMGRVVDTIRVVDGNTAFALELYGKLRSKEEGNLFLAPHSISTALGMTYAGARSNTATQMEAVLHFTLPPEKLHPAMGSLLDSDDHEGYQLNVANSLWGQKGREFLADFLTLTAEHYGAGLTELDFAKDVEAARQIINGWVSDRTETMIPDLLQPEDLDAGTELVLTNAIYFKGKWASPFDPKRTRDGDFWISADEAVAVPMMEQSGKFPTHSTDTVDIVELPYGGERIAMTVIVPKARDGLAGVETSLREKLPEWIESLKEETLRVRIPRFRTETRFDLAETLAAMGMSDAFHPRRADFSGMTAGGGLFIDKVITQAVAEVNEEGTEAAGATAVIMKRGRVAQVNADHPFLFLIRDTKTGAVLFLGRVVNPA